MNTPCTCGHEASEHNALGVCMALVRAEGLVSGQPVDALCSCEDFTTDDVAVAKAAGVLVGEVTRPDGSTHVAHLGIDQ